MSQWTKEDILRNLNEVADDIQDAIDKGNDRQRQLQAMLDQENKNLTRLSAAGVRVRALTTVVEEQLT